MRYKPLGKSRRRAVTVPRLDGGLNLFDPPAAIADNQLTDCVNMWWHRGALRVRPGLIGIGAGVGDFDIAQPLGDDEMLFIDYHADGYGNRTFRALLQRADGTKEDFGLSRGRPLTLADDPSTPCTAFGCYAPRALGCDFLFFLGGGQIYAYDGESGSLTPAAPYRPQVVTDGAPTAALIDGSPVGTLLEYPNRLANTALATYSTDGKGTYFYLPADFRGAALSLSLTLHDALLGTTYTIDPTASVVFNADSLGFDRETYTYVTVKCDYTPAAGAFRLYGVAERRAGGGNDIVAIPAHSRNNLRAELIGYRGYDPTSVCRMTTATWYGGLRGGVNDGTRLFVAGDGRYPHRLMWSQEDNPLYFPDRNRVTVGDDHTAITALAKQDDRLIIFKEQEIHCADYVSESDPVTTVSSDPEERQAARAYFPLTLLSTDVGCDAPATVKGVNNRLVWMTAAGKLYTLTAVDIYKNRCVREISALIEPALAAHPLAERRLAGGGSYDGRYLLAIGKTVYVLDCRAPAFLRFGRYADELSALRSLVYHRWELPAAERYRMITGGGNLVFLAIGEGTVLARRLGGETDSGAAIAASFATRHFPADPTRRMSVEAAYLAMSDPARPVKVSFLADGVERPAAVITAAETALTDRLIPRRLAPGPRRAAAFGIRCEGDAGYAVGELTVIARENGTIR